MITTDLKIEPDQPKIIVFPNPISATLNINGCENCEVEIYDLLGRLVLKSAFNNQIDLSFLSDGGYLLKIFDGKTSMLKKIIKYH